MPKDMNGVELQVGDRVTWSSQAAGSWKQKTGTVVYAGEPCGLWELPAPVREELFSGIQMFDVVSTGMVVKVPGKSPKSKPRFYAPRLTKLRKITD